MSKIYCDGSGWNGQRSACVVYTESDGEFHERKFSGIFTNNQMEYMAVIEAIKMAKDGDTILSDSQLVVHQVSGAWRCKSPELALLLGEVEYLRKNVKVDIKWIGRNNNIAGKYFENKSVTNNLSDVKGLLGSGELR